MQRLRARLCRYYVQLLFKLRIRPALARLPSFDAEMQKFENGRMRL